MARCLHFDMPYPLKEQDLFCQKILRQNHIIIAQKTKKTRLLILSRLFIVILVYFFKLNLPALVIPQIRPDKFY